MSGPIGHTFIYNIIILFIVIVFAFLAGTLSYYKAFKVNNRIISAVEKYEGYNALSKTEIERSLGTIGYSLGSAKCKQEYKKMQLVSIRNEEKYKYCIYVDKESPRPGEYYTYGVLTYMNFDLPVVKMINIPIFTRSNRIYKF
ncbi:MAG: hypothetical protein RSB71_00320 [Bacilli bacterium]